MEQCHIETIQENAVRRKLKKETNDGRDPAKGCPSNFFSLSDTSVNVDELVRKRIFEMIFLRKIFEVILKCGYHRQQSSQGIKGFIGGNSKCLKKLQDHVACHYYGEEIVKILAKIPGLETFPEAINYFEWLDYDDLCRAVQKVVLYAKVKKMTDNWRDVSMVCPKTFSPLIILA